jgi:hypothetical protein
MEQVGNVPPADTIAGVSADEKLQHPVETNTVNTMKGEVFTGNAAEKNANDSLNSASSTSLLPSISKTIPQREKGLNRARNALEYDWVAEYCCCVVALASFAAIIITLRVHQNKPLPNWPFSITINALVSLFATILKGALSMVLSEGMALILPRLVQILIQTGISQVKWELFRRGARPLHQMDEYDSASRGPWGSLGLLFDQLKFRMPPR